MPSKYKEFLKRICPATTPEVRRSHFRQNLVVGVVILLLTWWFEGCTPPGEALNNFTADWIMLIEHWANDPQVSTLAFVDIDYGTEVAWTKEEIDATEAIPRDSLARLIGRIIASEPRVVVLDMILSPRHCSDPTADRALLDTFAQVARNHPQIPIVFATDIGAVDKKVRPLIVDDLIREHAQLFHRGSPEFERLAKDPTVRYMKPCSDASEYLEQVPYLAVRLYNNAQPYPCEEDLERYRYLLKLANPYAQNRKSKDGSNIEDSGDPLRFIAGDVLAEPDGAIVPVLRGRIVIVGRSSAETGDIHETPIRKMAGM
jgi:hypothetical protein